MICPGTLLLVLPDGLQRFRLHVARESKYSFSLVWSAGPRVPARHAAPCATESKMLPVFFAVPFVAPRRRHRRTGVQIRCADGTQPIPPGKRSDRPRDVDPKSECVERAQEDAAMVWLEPIRISDHPSFASITERLEPALMRGMPTAKSLRPRRCTNAVQIESL